MSSDDLYRIIGQLYVEVYRTGVHLQEMLKANEELTRQLQQTQESLTALVPDGATS